MNSYSEQFYCHSFSMLFVAKTCAFLDYSKNKTFDMLTVINKRVNVSYGISVL